MLLTVFRSCVEMQQIIIQIALVQPIVALGLETGGAMEGMDQLRQPVLVHGKTMVLGIITSSTK